MFIKNICAVLITRDDNVLVIGEDSDRYRLPCAVQSENETMESAVNRGVSEEIGTSVKAISIVGCGEKICMGLHLQYHVFACELDPAAEIKGVWLALSDCKYVYPRMIGSHLFDMAHGFTNLGCEDDGKPIIEHGNITIKYLQKYIGSKDCRKGAEETYFVKIIEEAGELARLVIRGAPKAEGKSFKGTYEEELWDVMYYVIALANLYDVDLEKWIPIKEEYNNERYHQGLRFDPDEWSLLKHE